MSESVEAYEQAAATAARAGYTDAQIESLISLALPACYTNLCPNQEEAEQHRANARDIILKIANSFDADEPVRASLLSAAPVRPCSDRSIEWIMSALPTLTFQNCRTVP
jgi:hypothetical protein